MTACLSVVGGWLLLAITIITAYWATSDGSTLRQKEQAAYHQTGLLTETDNCFKHCTYVYILYLKSEDASVVILFTGLPITTNLAGEWLNSLIFQYDIKCITAYWMDNQLC